MWSMMWIPLSIFALIVAVWMGYSWLDHFEPDVLLGKRVLITGASTGIGEQLAYHYARLGAKVVITARREMVLKGVVDRCKELSSHNDQYYIVGDMSNLKTTENIIREVKKRLGGLDVLVLNHVSDYHLGWWTGKENLTDFNRRTNINYLSYVHLATHALPLLRKSAGSSIVVVSTVTSITGMPMNGEYPASKLALRGFFMSLRQQFEILEENISVTICMLGAVRTENLVNVFKNEDLLGQDVNEAINHIEPTDAAWAIVRAGALRKKETFYPSHNILMTMPGANFFIDYMIKRVFSTAKRPNFDDYDDR